MDYEKLLEIQEKKLKEALEEQTHKHNVEMKEIQKALDEQKKQKIELEDRVSKLSHEVEMRDRELQQKTEDVATLRHQIIVTEKSRSVEIEELRTHFEHKTKIELKDSEIRISAERAAFETSIMQLQQKVEELQQNVDVLYKDKAELKDLLGIKSRELESLKARESSKQEELEEAKKQMEHLKRLLRVAIIFHFYHF